MNCPSREGGNSVSKDVADSRLRGNDKFASDSSSLYAAHKNKSLWIQIIIRTKFFFVFLSACAFVWTNSIAARTLNRGNGPEPATLDAHKAQDLASFNLLRDLYEGLVSEDAHGEPIAGMAKSWRQSANGLRWEFELRADLFWSNGGELNANQIVASFQRALDPTTGAPFASQLYAIKNAEQIGRGVLKPASLGVTVSNKNTIVFELIRPVPLDRLLTLPICFPVNLAQLKRFDERHTRAENFIGNGAYRIRSWSPQSFIELERNDFFHARDTVKIKNVRFHVTEDAASELKRFQAGDLDFTETVPPLKLAGLRKEFGNQIKVSAYLGVFYYGLNLRRAPFKSRPQIRAALSLALDRDILVRYVTGMGEQAATRLLPPSLPGFAHNPYLNREKTLSENLQIAKKLMLEAGYSKQNPLQIELRYNTSSLNRKLALAVSSMWREHLGVKTRLINEEWKVFVVNRKHAHLTQVFRGGWIADYADAMSFLEPFESKQGLNTTGFSDAEFDRLLTQARAAPSMLDRTQFLMKAEARLLAHHAIVPIYFYTSKHLVNPALAGVEANALDHHASRFLSWRTQ